MRRMMCAAVITACCLAAAGGSALNAQAARESRVQITGVPLGSELELALNGPKPDLDRLVRELSKFGKRRVSVYVDRCKDGKVVKMLMVVEGNEPPPKDEDCDRTLLGVFRADQTVSIDLGANTLVTANGGIPGKTILLAGIGGVAVAVALAAGGGGSDAVASSPIPTTPAVNTPATLLCGSIAGIYSYLATLRQPRTCTLGTVPVFQTSINGTVTLEMGTSCMGVATTRYPNGWVFTYQVSAAPSAQGFSVRSPSPLSHTQPFGAQFNSSVDLNVSGTTCSGTETHVRVGGGPSCTDVYQSQCTKQ